MTFKVISEADKTCQVGDGLYQNPSIDISIGGEVSIPDPANGYSVVRIGDYAFYGCEYVTTVAIPERVTTIGYASFSGSGVGFAKFTLPESLTSIDDYAFCCCRNLTRVIIPDGVVRIGINAFSSSPLSDFDIPKSVTNIASGAFTETHWSNSRPLYELLYKDQWLLGYRDFFDFPQNGHLEIDPWTKGVTGFAYCSYIVSVTCPPTLKYIGEKAFSDTDIREINLPEGLLSIGKNAFMGCYYLRSITIPSTVTNIEGAFLGCGASSYTSMIRKPFEIGEKTFRVSDDGSINATLYVPKGTKKRYEATPIWNKFKTIEEFDDGYDGIDDVGDSATGIEQAAYDLQGRRVSVSSVRPKGVYIQGGKKYVK